MNLVKEWLWHCYITLLVTLAWVIIGTNLKLNGFEILDTLCIIPAVLTIIHIWKATLLNYGGPPKKKGK